METHQRRLRALRQNLPSGIRARPCTLQDAAQIATLVNDGRGAIGDPFLDSEGDVRESLSDPFVELEVDGVTAETDDGSLAGYALAYRVVDGAKPRVFLFGATSPRHWGEGIGRALLAWSSDRAREILEPHPLGTIRHSAATKTCAPGGCTKRRTGAQSGGSRTWSSASPPE